MPACSTAWSPDTEATAPVCLRAHLQATQQQVATALEVLLIKPFYTLALGGALRRCGSLLRLLSFLVERRLAARASTDDGTFAAMLVTVMQLAPQCTRCCSCRNLPRSCLDSCCATLSHRPPASPQASQHPDSMHQLSNLSHLRGTSCPLRKLHSYRPHMPTMNALWYPPRGHGSDLSLCTCPFISRLVAAKVVPLSPRRFLTVLFSATCQMHRRRTSWWAAAGAARRAPALQTQTCSSQRCGRSSFCQS